VIAQPSFADSQRWVTGSDPWPGSLAPNPWAGSSAPSLLPLRPRSILDAKQKYHLHRDQGAPGNASRNTQIRAHKNRTPSPETGRHIDAASRTRRWTPARPSKAAAAPGTRIIRSPAGFAAHFKPLGDRAVCPGAVRGRRWSSRWDLGCWAGPPVQRSRDSAARQGGFPGQRRSKRTHPAPVRRGSKSKGGEAGHRTPAVNVAALGMRWTNRSTARAPISRIGAGGAIRTIGPGQ